MHGVTTFKGDLLKKELEIFTFRDLLELYPFRHVDKTKLDTIAGLSPINEYAQVAGKLTHLELVGEGKEKGLPQNCRTIPAKWNWFGSVE
ncbi:MAG: hypothetical protein IPG38_15735 [Chitinophagaceae bacterium]|nr:hypothetical protein [Chitinophagaceae bacterium]